MTVMPRMMTMMKKEETSCFMSSRKIFLTVFIGYQAICTKAANSQNNESTTKYYKTKEEISQYTKAPVLLGYPGRIVLV